MKNYLEYFTSGGIITGFVTQSYATIHRSLMLSLITISMSLFAIFTLPSWLRAVFTASEYKVSLDVAIYILESLGTNLLITYILAFIFLGNFRQWQIEKEKHE